MNKQELTEGILYAGLRLIAIVLLLTGGLGLLFQVVESWYRFDPNYLLPFLLDTLFRPACLFTAGIFLFLFARYLSRIMSGHHSS